MSEIEELQKAVQELKTQVSVLSRKIGDVDDSMANHIGLDWGETLADANSPHPNMSVNSLAYGGGVGLLTLKGMQLALEDLTQPGIFFLEKHTEDPLTTYPHGAIGGFATPTIAGLQTAVYGDATHSIRENFSANTTNNQEWLLTGANGSDTDYVQFFFMNPGWVFAINKGALLLGRNATNPASLINGMVWYNTTDAKIYAYINGAITALGGGGMELIVKEADESVTTNTTVQNDDDFVFPIASNESIQFEMLIFGEGSDGGIDVTFAVPAGAVGRFGREDLADFGAEITSEIPCNVGAAGVQRVFRGAIHNGSTAGNVQMQWAQTLSSGTSTIHAGSYIKWQVQ